MKRTFKVMGSLLLATSLIFGVVSCDNPSKGVDGSGTESDSGAGGGSELDKTDPFVAAIADVKTYPTNEEEFVEMLDTVVTEVSESISSVMGGNQRSIVTTVGEEAKTALEIVEQVNAFAKAVFECLPEYGNSIVDIHEIKIDFDEQINIGKVSFTEWFKALCEVYDNVVSQINKWMNSNEQSPSSEDLVEVMYESLELTEAQFEDYLVLLDDFVAIDKLYLNLDADADFEHFTYQKYYFPCCDCFCENYDNSSENCEHTEFGWNLDFENVLEHKDEKLAAADVDYILAATVVDIEGLVNTILQDFFASNIEMTLPVKAISAKSEFAVNAEATYGDILSFMQPSEEGVSITQADVNSEVEYKVAVCTKEKVGGIVTITVATSPETQDILDIINVGYNTDGQNTDAMMAKYDKMVSIKITVSDGSKEVYSDTMLYSEFIDFIMEMAGVDVSGSGKVEY